MRPQGPTTRSTRAPSVETSLGTIQRASRDMSHRKRPISSMEGDCTAPSPAHGRERDQPALDEMRASEEAQHLNCCKGMLTRYGTRSIDVAKLPSTHRFLPTIVQRLNSAHCPPRRCRRTRGPRRRHREKWGRWKRLLSKKYR